MPINGGNISGGGGGAAATTAAAVTCDTTNFDNNLSPADATVQAALETLDELIAGGTLAAKDEGAAVGNITTLNFVGADVSVVLNGVDPTQLDIYIPALTFAPYYNSSNPIGNAVVNTIATTNRNIADPAPENNYGIGGWAAGSVQPSLITTPLNYSHTDECSFEDLTTTVEATLYGPDDVTPVATFTTAAIVGNTVQGAGGITITISNWAADSIKYQANIAVSFNLAAIIPNGGRFSIEIIHHDAGTDYTKTQGPMFYDAQPLAGTVTGVTIVENAAVTKFLSGVEYYDLGSTFQVDIADLDYLNSNTYLDADLIELSGTEYGLPALTPGSGDLTGWLNDWNDDNNTYSNNLWAITAANFFTASLTANVNARALDWVNGAWVPSADAAIAVETHALASTATIERFYDEQWRCPVAGNFDLPAQRSWNSAIDVLITDAVFYNGGAERNITDFTVYAPNAAGQPDYSTLGMNPTVYLIREFQHTGAASSGFNITLTGTYTSLELKLAKAWDGTPTGGTTWVDMTAAYNAAQWNNGQPLAGTGSLTGGTHHTFGTNNIINTSDTMYIRIGFSVGERITALSVVFD